MFCKWCGNDLQVVDLKCPACGRNTPPMSDCGGFYNLHHANFVTATPAKPMPEGIPLVPELPPTHLVEKRPEQIPVETRERRKKHRILPWICLVVLVLSIAAAAMLLMRGEGKDQDVGIQNAETKEVEMQNEEVADFAESIEAVPSDDVE